MLISIMDNLVAHHTKSVYQCLSNIQSCQLYELVLQCRATAKGRCIIKQSFHGTFKSLNIQIQNMRKSIKPQTPDSVCSNDVQQEVSAADTISQSSGHFNSYTCYVHRQRKPVRTCVHNN